MTVQTEADERRRKFQGYLASVGSAAGYGLGTYLGFLVIREGVPPITASFFSLLFGLMITALLFYRPALNDVKLASPRGWVVVSMSGLASAWGVASLYLSLEQVSVVVASPVAGANPLVAILMTHFFLQRLERVSVKTVVGAVLVVAGVTLVTVGTA